MSRSIGKGHTEAFNFRFLVDFRGRGIPTRTGFFGVDRYSETQHPKRWWMRRCWVCLVFLTKSDMCDYNGVFVVKMRQSTLTK